MKNKLMQEYLKECLHYDPETGIFTWNTRPESHFKNSHVCNWWNSHYSGNKAGCLSSDSGYILIAINSKLYRAHRLSFLYIDGYLPENDVDHINRIKDDNRWINLREVSPQCNAQNCKLVKNSTSGICGVSFEKLVNKWSAYITINDKKINLGYYENFNHAVMARYKEELNNPKWTCSVESTAYKYLIDNNLIEIFKSTDVEKYNIRSNNKSGIKGVYWIKSQRKWGASIKADKIEFKLGRFSNLDDAVMARYQGEINTPIHEFSERSSAFKYLKEKNLI